MFQSITVRGPRGALVWGAGEAAGLSAWSVARDRDFHWTLRAHVDRVDRYRLRQVPLLFTAPRPEKPAGLWSFPVLPNTLQLEGAVVTAQLGPPEGR